MIHDESHEVRQNKVLRLLALNLTQLAAHNGHSGMKTLSDEVEAILSSDEAEELVDMGSDAMVVAAPDMPAVVDAEFEESAPKGDEAKA